MFHGLRTVIYHVDDIGLAKKWYASVTGAQPYFDQPYYVGFNIGGYELGLDPDMIGISRGNNVVAYWRVEHIDEEMKRILSLGAGKNSDVQDVGGGVRVATLKDPFGNVFGIIEQPDNAHHE
jgi:predicted enzyme related to lactoylglutathione lyase